MPATLPGEGKRANEDEEGADGQRRIKARPADDPIARARPRPERARVHRERDAVAVADRQHQQPEQEPRMPAAARGPGCGEPGAASSGPRRTEGWPGRRRGRRRRTAPGTRACWTSASTRRVGSVVSANTAPTDAMARTRRPSAVAVDTASAVTRSGPSPSQLRGGGVRVGRPEHDVAQDDDAGHEPQRRQGTRQVAGRMRPRTSPRPGRRRPISATAAGLARRERQPEEPRRTRSPAWPAGWSARGRSPHARRRWRRPGSRARPRRDHDPAVLEPDDPGRDIGHEALVVGRGEQARAGVDVLAEDRRAAPRTRGGPGRTSARRAPAPPGAGPGPSQATAGAAPHPTAGTDSGRRTIERQPEAGHQRLRRRRPRRRPDPSSTSSRTRCARNWRSGSWNT